jgi:hypothetical protein
MTITTKQILRVLQILSWIIFIGICIQAGGFIFNSFFTLLLNPVGAKRFWQEVDLSALYYYDRGHFFAQTFLMCIVAVLKACMFYMIIKLLHNKKISMSQPFSNEVRRFIFRVSYLTLLIGLFSLWGVRYSEWLTSNGVKMPDIQYLGLGGGDVWLFMCVTLYVIAQIFKRGIEIQSENELTV